MVILYTLGAIFGFTIALIIALFIITRPETFDLEEESESLTENQNHEENEGRKAEKERD